MKQQSVSRYVTHKFTSLPHCVDRGQRESSHRLKTQLHVLSEGTIGHFHRLFAQDKCPSQSVI